MKPGMPVAETLPSTDLLRITPAGHVLVTPEPVQLSPAFRRILEAFRGGCLQGRTRKALEKAWGLAR